MRCVPLILLWLLVTLVPAPAETKEKEKVWKDPEYGFTLTPPPGWTLSHPASARLSMAAPESENGFAANINVMVQSAPGVTPEQYSEKSLKQAERYKGKLVSEKEVEANGRKGRQLHMTVTVESRELEILSTIFAVNNRIYLITATALPGNFKKYQPVFEANAKSFKL